MYLTTCNIGRGETPAGARENMSRVVHRHGIIGWQEIDEADAPDEHAILEGLLPADVTKAAWGSLNPITLGMHWKLIRQFRAVGCKGLAKYTPNRDFAVAVVSDRDGTLPAFTVINFHAPINRLATFTRRFSMRRRHKRLIKRSLMAGRSVFWTADTNDGRYPKMHPKERVLAHRGLDWIRFIPAPGGVDAMLLTQGTIDLTIDGHDAVWVEVHLKDTSRPFPKVGT